MPWVRWMVVAGWGVMVGVVTSWQWGGVRNSWEGQMSAAAATVGRLPPEQREAMFPELKPGGGDLAAVWSNADVPASWNSPGVRGEGMSAALRRATDPELGGRGECKLFDLPAGEAGAGRMVGVMVGGARWGGDAEARAVYLRPVGGIRAEQFWLAVLNGVIFFVPVAVLAAVFPRRGGK